MENIWQQLSTEISEKVATAGESIVAVDGRSGHTSSGIVWRTDHILTASHTIRGQGAIEVLSPSGKAIGARLVGHARAADVALLKLDAPLETKPVDFGD